MEGSSVDKANAWVIFAEEESGQASEVTEKKTSAQTNEHTQESPWSNQLTESTQEVSWSTSQINKPTEQVSWSTTSKTNEPTQEVSWSNQVTETTREESWSTVQVNNPTQEISRSTSETNEPTQDVSWSSHATEPPMETLWSVQASELPKEVSWSCQVTEPPKKVSWTSLVNVNKAVQVNDSLQEAESSQRSKVKTQEQLGIQTNKSLQEEESNELTIYQNLPTKYTKKEMMNLTYNVDNASNNLGSVAGRLLRVYSTRHESHNSNETGGWRRPVITNGTRESRDYTVRLSEGEYNEYTKSLIENKINFTSVAAPTNSDSKESSNSSNTDASNDSTMVDNSSSIRNLANIRTNRNGTMRYVSPNSFNSAYTLEVPDRDALVQRVINIKLLLKPTTTTN